MGKTKALKIAWLMILVEALQTQQALVAGRGRVMFQDGNKDTATCQAGVTRWSLVGQEGTCDLNFNPATSPCAGAITLHSTPILTGVSTAATPTTITAPANTDTTPPGLNGIMRNQDPNLSPTYCRDRCVERNTCEYVTAFGDQCYFKGGESAFVTPPGSNPGRVSYHIIRKNDDGTKGKCGQIASCTFPKDQYASFIPLRLPPAIDCVIRTTPGTEYRCSGCGYLYSDNNGNPVVKCMLDQGSPPSPDCAMGSYITADGACIACPPGTFSSAVNSRNCSCCSQGMSAICPGATSCTTCPANTYAAPSLVPYCRSLSGAGSCLPCPMGTTSPPGTANIQHCVRTDCPAGSYIATNGSCTVCPAGTFSTQVNSVGCQCCDMGRFAAAPGSTNCSTCPAGTYAENSRYPWPGCPALSGAARCMACPDGWASQAGGASPHDCLYPRYDRVMCNVGHPFYPACCPAGSTFSKAGRCTDCMPGMFNPQPGVVGNCQCCPAGYISGAAATNCTICPADTYTDFRTQTSACGYPVCTACPSGLKSPPGSSSLDNCRTP